MKKKHNKLSLIRPFQVLPSIQEINEESFERAERQELISNINKKKQELLDYKLKIVEIAEGVLDAEQQLTNVDHQLQDQKIDLKLMDFDKHIRKLLNIRSFSSDDIFIK